ncbi:hypothetical protein [Paludisphaera soli]|uniref:hypothetical protein n=1 Tax=Paludisphaera soli TaxID=2712865 RepID=UPI0013EB5C73|nr:hypothetical protein [Paludisphaera soli]
MSEKAAPIPRRAFMLFGIFATIGIGAHGLLDAWIEGCLASWIPDGLVLAIVAVAMSAYLIVGPLLAWLAINPEPGGASGGRLVAPIFLIAMLQGRELAPLFAHRLDLALGIACVYGLMLVLALTWLLTLAGNARGVGVAAFMILMLGLMNMTAWAGQASSQGLRSVFVAFAVPVGTRGAALTILAIRATAAANRREIENYRARRGGGAASLEA